MAPTRELAKQVASVFSKYGPELRVVCIYGGAPYDPQLRDIRKGADVVVATPGRLMDLLSRGDINLSQVSHVILDEADEMLRVGFKEQVDDILRTVPQERQTILFSATLPHWVNQISRQHLRNPRVIDLLASSEQKVVSEVSHIAIEVRGGMDAKQNIVADLLTFYQPKRCIIFTETKRVADLLTSSGIIRHENQVLHGGVAQTTRERTTAAFREGVFPVLIATSVAARGLDIPEIDLVIQFDMPQDSETYVHRSGRTGRAGRTGTCVTLFHSKERSLLDVISKAIGRQFQISTPPSTTTIAKQAAVIAGDNLLSVPHDAIDAFRIPAQVLLESGKPAEELIAAALATIAGFGRGLSYRSLLTSETGHRTLYHPGPYQMPARFLAKMTALLPDVRVGRVAICKDGGAAFDVPTTQAQSVLALEGFKSLETLPPLQARPEDRSERGSYSSRPSSSSSFGRSRSEDRPSRFGDRRGGDRDGDRYSRGSGRRESSDRASRGKW